MSGPPKTEDALQAIMPEYGLDEPIHVQYRNWMAKVAHGNLGWSRTAQQPVLEAIGSYFPATLELALWSFIPIMVGGIWLGVKRRSTTTSSSTRLCVFSAWSAMLSRLRLRPGDADDLLRRAAMVPAGTAVRLGRPGRHAAASIPSPACTASTPC